MKSLLSAKQNIFLIGPMAAGKSTIGRALARTLGLDFFDSDQEIIAHTGVEISLIFDIEGEDGFRKRESEILSDLVKRQPIVLATGGGAILKKENRERLAANGVVVYLSCSVDQQLKRTMHDTRRPLLQTENPRLKLDQLMKERGPIYESLADIRVNTERRNSKSVLKELLSKLDQYSNCHNKTQNHEAV